MLQFPSSSLVCGSLLKQESWFPVAKLRTSSPEPQFASQETQFIVSGVLRIALAQKEQSLLCRVLSGHQQDMLILPQLPKGLSGPRSYL